MAHKKAGSSSKNGRDSVGQRLGVKAGDGQLVPAGSIIVRQRGQTFLSGTGTGIGRDYTVFATVTGRVRFEHATKSKKRIRVVTADEVAAAAAAATKETKPARTARTATASAAKTSTTRRAKTTDETAPTPAAEA
jgi:large subunit ribosomal protein L27